MGGNGVEICGGWAPPLLNLLWINTSTVIEPPNPSHLLRCHHAYSHKGPSQVMWRLLSHKALGLERRSYSGRGGREGMQAKGECSSEWELSAQTLIFAYFAVQDYPSSQSLGCVNVQAYLSRIIAGGDWCIFVCNKLPTTVHLVWSLCSQGI